MARDECIAAKISRLNLPGELANGACGGRQVPDAMVYIGETGNRAARGRDAQWLDERTARPEIMPDPAAHAP